jgi:hypothetical protein
MQGFLDEFGRKGGKNGRRRNNLIRSKPNQIGRRPGKPRKREERRHEADAEKLSALLSVCGTQTLALTAQAKGESERKFQAKPVNVYCSLYCTGNFDSSSKVMKIPFFSRIVYSLQETSIEGQCGFSHGEGGVLFNLDMGSE